jgi:N-acylneuraminate cytidylyltransferase
MDQNGRLAPFFPEFELFRTQDLERAYHDAGQFYWGTKVAWLKNVRIHSSALALPIPSQCSIDIDTLQDWEKAESLFRTTQKIQNSF